MSKNQQLRSDIIRQANSGLLTVPKAAFALGISERQVQRLKKIMRISDSGDSSGLNSIRKAYNSIPEDIKNSILEIKNQEEYINCNFYNFNEILSNFYDIKISYSTLYKILSYNGYKSPKTRRRFKRHTRIKKITNSRVLFQLVSPSFAWFGNKEEYILHIDIANTPSQISAIYLKSSEDSINVTSMKESPKKFSKFIGEEDSNDKSLSIVRLPDSDWISITPHGNTVYQNNSNHFGKPPKKNIGTKLIAPRSPHSKLRIDRLWEILQGWLSIEFAQREIKSIDQANKYLRVFVQANTPLGSYISNLNDRFILPMDSLEGDIIKALAKFNFDEDFMRKKKLSMKRAGLVSIKNASFKMDKQLFEKKNFEEYMKRRVVYKNRDTEILDMISEIFQKSYK
ncbi:MAG: hypothetical protein WCF96_05390 [Eubacteriales bacterium]